MAKPRTLTKLSYHQLLILIPHIERAFLDDVAREVWRGYADGALTEAQALVLAAEIEQRRPSPAWMRAGMDTPLGHSPRLYRPR